MGSWYELWYLVSLVCIVKVRGGIVVLSGCVYERKCCVKEFSCKFFYSLVGWLKGLRYGCLVVVCFLFSLVWVI